MLHIEGLVDYNSLTCHFQATGWVPCVYEIHNFVSVYLFSLETQHTIGYGSRQTTEECPEAVFIMSVQAANIATVKLRCPYLTLL